MATGVISVPVSYLTGEARSILDHLNTRRLFASDGPGNLPRDVRGLANLFGFTAQESENLSIQSAVEMWIGKNEPSATVELLLRYLEIIDRYDVRDDLQELAATNKLVIDSPMPDNMEAYTTDDLELGCPQFYDALVIYAEENCIFVQTMFNVMQEIGFKLFKKHSLEPGYMKQEAMAEMIDARCRYTILVFSPAFFNSLDEKFYSQYVHAKQIADNKRHMIPIVYQKCQPFKEFMFYTTLQVTDSQFWRRLALNLNNGRTPRLDIPSWLASVNVQPADILPTLPVVRMEDYNPPRAGNETRYRSEANRPANSLSQPTTTFLTSQQAVNETQGRFDGNRRIDTVHSNRPTNVFVTNSHVNQTQCQTEANRPIINSHSSQNTNMFVTTGQVTNKTIYPTEANRPIVNGHSNQNTNIFVTTDQVTNKTINPTEANRPIVNGHSSQNTNIFVTTDQVTNETIYPTEANRPIVNGHSSQQQHNDVFVTNRTPNRPVADRVSDESSNQPTHAANGSIANRHVTDTVANTNSQDAEAQIGPQPAYEYLVSVQIVADHFREHTNSTDVEPNQCNLSSISNIPNDQTVNSQSSLLTSATQSSLSSTSLILSDQTVDSQSNLLTTSSSTPSSFIDDFARWCRNRRLWGARNRLFQNRIRRAK